MTRTRDLPLYKLEGKEREAEVNRILKSVFSTSEGAIALSFLMDEHYYGRPTTTAEEVGLKNWLESFLGRLEINTDSLAVATAMIPK
jgi:hypothetical protein